MSSVSSLGGSSPLNLSGLASGIDTNTIVQQLMAIDRQPETALKLRQTTEAARQSALQTVQTKLQALQSAEQALSDPGLWANTQSVDVNDPTKVSATFSSGTGPGAYQINVSQLARASQHWFSYTPQGTDGTINIGSYSHTVTANTDINTVASDINSDGSAPVYASVVTSGGSQYLVMSSRTTGAASDFSATGASLAEDTTKKVAGLDSQYSVNGGATLTSAGNVVTDAVPGLSITLKGTTTVSGPVTVTVGAPSASESNVQGAVSNFVNAYNDAVSYIQTQLTTHPVPNAQNATDASTGTLYGDLQLQSLLDQLRESVSSTYVPTNPSTMQMLSQLGVSTGAAVGSGTLNQDSINGKLTLDTTAFSTAFTSDPQSVKNLLGGTISTPGFAQAFDAALNPTIEPGGTLATRISDETTAQSDITDQIAQMELQLTQKQQMLQQQFTNMETAMSQSQAQQSWLTGQIAQLPGHA